MERLNGGTWCCSGWQTLLSAVAFLCWHRSRAHLLQDLWFEGPTGWDSSHRSSFSFLCLSAVSMFVLLCCSQSLRCSYCSCRCRYKVPVLLLPFSSRWWLFLAFFFFKPPPCTTIYLAVLVLACTTTWHSSSSHRCCYSNGSSTGSRNSINHDDSFGEVVRLWLLLLLLTKSMMLLMMIRSMRIAVRYRRWRW